MTCSQRVDNFPWLILLKLLELSKFDLFMTCSQFVYVLLITCSWLVHNLFMIRFVYDLFINGSWLVTTCSLVVHNLFRTCSCLIHDLFLTCTLVHNFLTNCSWLVHQPTKELKLILVLLKLLNLHRLLMITYYLIIKRGFFMT